MITQVWRAKQVPNLVPEFVDPHITVDDGFFPGDEGYIFEVNPGHKVFSKTKNVEKEAKRILTSLGFTGLMLVYHGEKPDHLVAHSHDHH